MLRRPSTRTIPTGIQLLKKISLQRLIIIIKNDFFYFVKKKKIYNLNIQPYLAHISSTITQTSLSKFKNQIFVLARWAILKLET